MNTCVLPLYTCSNATLLPKTVASLAGHSASGQWYQEVSTNCATDRALIERSDPPPVAPAAVASHGTVYP